MKKRRVIIIVIVFGVIGGLCAGFWWYTHRNSRAKLLARTELAFRAGKYDRAIVLANSYIGKYPNDWRGYFIKARSMIRTGQYDNARVALKKAHALKASEVSILLEMAKSYSLPAQRKLTDRNVVSRSDLLKKIIKQFQKANEILLGVKTSDKAQLLDIQEKIGLNYQKISIVWQMMGQKLQREIQVAKAAGGTSNRIKVKQRESAAAFSKSDEAADKSIKYLFEVIQQDADRPLVAKILVRLCINRGDRKTLKSIRTLFESLQHLSPPKAPPPTAMLMLVMYDLRYKEGVVQRHDELMKISHLLDKRIKDNPKELEAKLARANVALALRDTVTAERLSKEVLKVEPRNGTARLIQSMALMKRGEFAKAERILFALKTDYPTWPDAYFAYAQATMATGKKQLALEALRTVTKLDPEHPLARRYLAESFLEEGYYREAFTDAKAYYQAHPDDPIALRLFVASALHTDQPGVAMEALTKAETTYKNRPEMLISVAKGYRLVGKIGMSLHAFQLATKGKPDTVEARLAIAQAFRALGNVSRAEKILIEGLASDPEQPRLHYELGQIYASTGQLLPAIEQFQTAVRLDNLNEAYRLAFAKALFNIGDLDHSQEILKRISPDNVDANLLRFQIGIIRDEPVEQIAQRILSAGVHRKGFALAVIYITAGRVKEGIKICLDELERTPDSPELHFLLGQAYLMQGQKEKCLFHWKKVVQIQPERLFTYVQIATLLALKHSPKEVEKSLISIPGAHSDMVYLTMGQLYSRFGRFSSAIEAYSKVIDNEDYPASSRYRAQLLRARVLAITGNIEQAVDDLNALAKVAPLQQMVLVERTRLLFKVGKIRQAKASLAELYKIASDRKDFAALARVARLYVQMRQFDSALKVCKDIEKLYPDDVGSYLLRASILAQSQRNSEAIPLLYKAIKQQPRNFGIYITLAQALDREQKFREALAVLEQLEKISGSGKAAAVFARSLLFANWGLYSKALDCLQELANQGYGSIPRTKIVLGRIFAQLGQIKRAKEVLKSIPIHSIHYPEACQLLVEIAKSDEDKLYYIHQAERINPANPNIVLEKMKILLHSGNATEAVKTYQMFRKIWPKYKPLPTNLHRLAIRAMIKAGKWQEASELSVEMFKESHMPVWRRMAILLDVGDREKEELINKMLPEISKSTLVDAILGFIVSVDKRDTEAAQDWRERINQVFNSMSKRDKSGQKIKSFSLHIAKYNVLIALASGQLPQAKKWLMSLGNNGGVLKSAMEEMISWAAENKADAAREALELLKVSIAIDIGANELGKILAMRILRARPNCQWAAMMIAQSDSDDATLKEVLRIIRPKHCSVARMIRATLLMNSEEYKEAAALYRQIAAEDKADISALMGLALAVEKMGRFKEAITIYHKVWEITKNPVVANNEAYLTAYVYPDVPDKLSEALKKADVAIQAYPQASSFRDTRGWILYLLGRKTEALYELRRTVKGLPLSPEVHYHLGVVETDANNRNLGQWHFQAVIDSAKAIETKGGKLSVAEVRAVKLAKKALARMQSVRQ